MKRLVCAGLALACALARGFSEENPGSIESEVADTAREATLDESTAQTNDTRAISPALVSLALTAGTGSIILSGVDWSDDDAAAVPERESPAQVQPQDGAQLAGPLVTFTWESVKGADTYLLDVDTCGEPDVCSDFRLDRTAALSLAIEWPAGIPAGRWRVRAVDADNIAGPWSAFRSFTILSAAD